MIKYDPYADAVDLDWCKYMALRVFLYSVDVETKKFLSDLDPIKVLWMWRLHLIFKLNLSCDL